MTQKNELDFEALEYIVIAIPKNSKKLKVTASFYDEKSKTKNPKKAKMRLDKDGLKEARDMYLQLDPDDDAFVRYEITPKGLELLKEFEERNEWEAAMLCATQEDITP